MFTRRQFLQTGIAAGGGLVLANTLGRWSRVQAQTTLLDPGTLNKFVNPLPIPGRIDATTGKKFNIEMRDTVQDLLGNGSMTKVWGYGLPGKGVTYPGSTFVAKSGVPIEVFWQNKLPKGSPPKSIAHPLPVDTTTHLANPIKKILEKGNIPVVPHLHGGHTESASDGLPEAWFTQGHAEKGPTWVKKKFRYDNDQEAATLWYHDHALGITRLNVYAGLAGFYLLRDDNELSRNLPTGEFEIEIVIQDRMFDTSGQLFFPFDFEPAADPCNPTLQDCLSWPGGPSILPEFFGNIILVNGKAWPQHQVKKAKYRLRLLNGSDSRFYYLKFEKTDGTLLPFSQIGTDNGLLPEPVSLNKLLLAPGERADLVVEFVGEDTGTEIILKNDGPEGPYKGLDNSNRPLPSDDGLATGKDTGLIMKFIVGSNTVSQSDIVTPLRMALPNPNRTPDTTRKVALFEGRDEYNRLQPLLGSLKLEGETWKGGSQVWAENVDPISERPIFDETEVWEIYNFTEDGHPIHLHLVAFQIIERYAINFSQVTVTERTQLQHDGSKRMFEKYVY
ncbi:MAG: multicopper oxidase domain-containing protein [Calothrix sp. MO_167.B12]|nr:multicopper oxidase domain-containing protein [Calothrix sp. MO_167.B12]